MTKTNHLSRNHRQVRCFNHSLSAEDRAANSSCDKRWPNIQRYAHQRQCSFGTSWHIGMGCATSSKAVRVRGGDYPEWSQSRGYAGLEQHYVVIRFSETVGNVPLHMMKNLLLTRHSKHHFQESEYCQSGPLLSTRERNDIPPTSARLPQSRLHDEEARLSPNSAFGSVRVNSLIYPHALLSSPLLTRRFMMALSRTHADCVIRLVMNATMPRYNTSAWMDTEIMIKSARKAFQGVAVQAVLDHFSQEANGTLSGSASWTEQRLILRTLSFWLVTSLLVMLIIIAAVLCRQSSPLVVPRDPGSIAGLAAIIASSPDINSSLLGVAESEKATRDRVKSLAPYRTEYLRVGEGQQFQISAPAMEAPDHTLLHPVSAQQQKWYVEICICPLHLT
jgi:hypothetical protein